MPTYINEEYIGFNMNIEKAIKKAQKENKVSVVNNGVYSSIKNLSVRVKPISRINESQDHFIVDRHEKVLSEMVGNVESKEDLPSEAFIIQFVEDGDSTMSDITEDGSSSDVFDEKIFTDVDSAIQWIENTGYI